MDVCTTISCVYGCSGYVASRINLVFYSYESGLQRVVNSMKQEIDCGQSSQAIIAVGMSMLSRSTRYMIGPPGLARWHVTKTIPRQRELPSQSCTHSHDLSHQSMTYQTDDAFFVSTKEHTFNVAERLPARGTNIALGLNTCRTLMDYEMAFSPTCCGSQNAEACTIDQAIIQNFQGTHRSTDRRQGPGCGGAPSEFRPLQRASRPKGDQAGGIREYGCTGG